mmetsp:Transcript_4494/g.9878  ORF Transcript_4494/g.9878 Transcript_4494/m.9878 type:complete len:109 (+) Transcript_4494:382-708(+)
MGEVGAAVEMVDLVGVGAAGRTGEQVDSSPLSAPAFGITSERTRPVPCVPVTIHSNYARTLGCPPNAVVEVKCGHHFHKGCISQWGVNHSTCPVCRHALYHDHLALYN